MLFLTLPSSLSKFRRCLKILATCVEDISEKEENNENTMREMCSMVADMLLVDVGLDCIQEKEVRF